MKNKKVLKGAVKTLLGILFWVALWGALSLIVDKEIIFASPWTVAKKLLILFGDPTFWKIVVYSIARILLGFIAGLGFGVILAIVSRGLGEWDVFISPLITVVKSTPVASFIILAWYWFDTGNIPSLISFLMALPIIWANVSEGIGNVPADLCEMAKVFRAAKWPVFKNIYLPAVMPYFRSAATTALGLCWKAGVAAEVLCHPDFSIGEKLYDAKIYLETSDLFAWTIVVIALSLIIEKILKSLLSLGGVKK